MFNVRQYRFFMPWRKVKVRESGRKPKRGFECDKCHIVCTLLVSISLVSSLQGADVQAEGFRTETRRIPREESEIPPIVGASENYTDTLIEVVLGNEDVENRTMKNVTYVITPKYNVTFEILNVSKGTFDEATFFYGSDLKVKFVMFYLHEGEDCRGKICVEIPLSKGEGVKVKADGRLNYGFDDETGAYAKVGFGWTPYNTGLHLGVGLSAYGTDLELASYDWFSEPVPEFPSGHLIALGSGILIFIVFRRKFVRPKVNH